MISDSIPKTQTMRSKTSKTMILALCAGILAPAFLHADEAGDLINKILQSSPSESAKAASYKSRARAAKKSNSIPANSIGIPESQLVEATSKFVGDVNGKYVYGPVTLKGIKVMMGEPCVELTASNNRIFLLYTRDSAVIEAFNSDWGTRYMIPKNFPLRVVGKPFPGMYSVRMPYDEDTTNHGFGELLNKAVKDATAPQ